MRRFNRKAFLFIFGIASSILFAVGLTIVVNLNLLGFVTVLLAIIFSLLSSFILAALLACYRYPGQLFIWIYRGIMRRLAKRAFRSSLSYAMTRIACLGILEINGGVGLRVDLNAAEISEILWMLNVYDAANNDLWGRVNFVEAQDSSCIYEPLDRTNPEFWEYLEGRMKFDTTAPSVYLVLEPPSNLITSVDHLLNAWR